MNWFKSGKKTPAIQKQSSSAKHQKESDWQRPIVQAISGIADEIKNSTKENEKEDRARARRDNITIWLVFATFIAALAGDVIFFVTLQDARHAAKIQHSDTQDAAIENGRAWVGPTQASISGTIASGQTITATIMYENFGKEPATDTEIVPAISSISADKWFAQGKDGAMYRIDAFRSQCKNIPAYDDSFVVFPSIGGAGFNNITLKLKESEFEKNGIDPISFARISSGEDYLIINVCFVYKTFAQTKHTAFCFYYNAKDSNAATLSFCDGAYAD